MVSEADAALMMQLDCDGGKRIQIRFRAVSLSCVLQCSLVQGFSW